MIRSTPISSRAAGLILGLATIAVLGSASVAHAQYQAPPPGYYAPPPRYAYPPPPPPHYGLYRSGLVGGLSLGFGNISASNCPACGGGFGIEGHIGGMITPQFALLVDVWGVGHSYDDGAGGSTLTNSMFTVDARFWPLAKLWIQGGIGGARITRSDVTGTVYSDGDETALGVLAAGGVEIVQAGNFALDLQLRVGHGAYSGGGATNVAFLVGANWY